MIRPMEKVMTRTEQIPFYRHYDVIVAGGGVAGAAAALAACRKGKHVLLIEKSCILGGLSTIGLVNLFVPLCNGRGKQIIFGMAEEFMKLSIQYGWDTIPEEWKNGQPDHPTNVRYVSNFSQWIFALTLTELLSDSGVDLMFDTIVTDAVMNGKKCESIILNTKSGRKYCTAGIFVDTTGDADLLKLAGIPTILGKNYYTYCAQAATIKSCRKVVETNNMAYLRVSEFRGGGIDLHGHNQPPDIPLFSGVEADEINDYLIRNQKDLLVRIKETSRTDRDLLSIPSMPQFRTTRRIDGAFTLKETDAYRHFPDSIGTICDFERRDFLYEVPFGCLIHSDYPNLITAGRSASGDGFAWDLLRVIPPVILTGQAAGLAASLALEHHCGLSQVPIEELQYEMSKSGNTIHFSEEDVPEIRETASDALGGYCHI